MQSLLAVAVCVFLSVCVCVCERECRNPWAGIYGWALVEQHMQPYNCPELNPNPTPTATQTPMPKPNPVQKVYESPIWCLPLKPGLKGSKKRRKSSLLLSTIISFKCISNWDILRLFNWLLIAQFARLASTNPNCSWRRTQRRRSVFAVAACC